MCAVPIRLVMGKCFLDLRANGSEIPQRCVESSSKIDARIFNPFSEIWATPSPVESCNFSGSLAKDGSSVLKSIITLFVVPNYPDFCGRPATAKLRHVDNFFEKTFGTGEGNQRTSAAVVPKLQ